MQLFPLFFWWKGNLT